MIPRYEKKAISKIWSENNKFQYYLDAELAILKAQEGINVPEGISQEIRNSAKIDCERIYEIEKETRHDMIAFCTSITEKLPTSIGKFFHYGVTSSDIIDTALSLQLRDSLKVILPAYKQLLQTLLSKAEETKNIMALGRSHGRNAEPMSFGCKFLSFYSELSRRYSELKDFYENELTAQFSGAVGNYTILSPEIEKKAAQILGLNVEPVSTQVIPRDRIAKLVSINALFGAALERICVELRHLHHSDIDEIEEGFSKKQKGSSTMPHKKNPIATENLTGMARMLRSHVSVALDNIILWHERDISHSSTERMYLPDNLGIMLYSIERLNSTLENLVVKQENIENKVTQNFEYLSSLYLHLILKESNIPREEVYYWVQEAAFAGKESGEAKVFHQKMKSILERHGVNLILPEPDPESLRDVFLKHAGDIFHRTQEVYSAVTK
ncbi:MAG: adenylosuccinate lyase [Bacteriovoracaceae bacterium]